MLHILKPSDNNFVISKSSNVMLCELAFLYDNNVSFRDNMAFVCLWVEIKCRYLRYYNKSLNNFQHDVIHNLSLYYPIYWKYNKIV